MPRAPRDRAAQQRDECAVPDASCHLIPPAEERLAEQLNATTPVMLTPLAVIAGLLIAFLASRVWSNLDRANTYVAQEASAIRQAVLLSDTLPEDTRTAVRAALKQHLRFIKTDDWPGMAQGRAKWPNLDRANKRD